MTSVAAKRTENTSRRAILPLTVWGLLALPAAAGVAPYLHTGDLVQALFVAVSLWWLAGPVVIGLARAALGGAEIRCERAARRAEQHGRRLRLCPVRLLRLAAPVR